MKSLISKVLLLSATLIVLSSSYTPAEAAVLKFSTPKAAIIGDEFSLIVQASSTDRSFNAAEAKILFPEDILEVVSINTSPQSTIFNFWLTPPSFSNKDGLILFSGGTTNGVLGEDIPIISVLMRVKGSGSALITASDASINASDGSGSNILEDVIAARLTVPKATVQVPPEPTTTEEVPAIREVVVETKSSPQIATSTEEDTEPTSTSTAIKTCSKIFFDCEIQFPQIKLVSVENQKNSWFNVLVSGSVSEGQTVRLTLRRDGNFYKEVIAIVKPDKTWEAVFTNIYSYGLYSVSARTEDESGRISQPAEWLDIHLLPPYTAHVFDWLIRWYFIVSAALGIVTLILGINILLKYLAKPKTKKRLPLWYILGFSVVTITFVVSSIMSYLIWKEEFSIQYTYWKDTDVPCITREHSFSNRYGGAKLKIIVDGESQLIPAELGISPTCVANIHTHDDTGNLHFEIGEETPRLTDFFKVTGVSLEKTGFTTSVTLNGKEFTDKIKTYQLRDKDQIVVTYTSVK